MATTRYKFDDISPREIEIEGVIKRNNECDSSYTSVTKTFLVLIRGEKAVMRTYPYHHWDCTGISCFQREKAAYERLKAHGVCEKGYVADYYGAIENADFSDVDVWVDDSEDVCAIFLEYIPNLQRLDKDLYTNDRWERAEKGIKAIHKAYILHDYEQLNHDAFISTDEARERVLWLNFSNSSVYRVDEPLDTSQQENILDETRVVKRTRKSILDETRAVQQMRKRLRPYDDDF
ncbi:hypothetical protein FQN55_003143 [Onygenales sp. PD_40]|nr:hypothetical protein FQN55_003143 [Onygenales sp. PD_40]KAK2797472.1 hypothetical protein FQN51_008505 [Onygenales sp. PD_10]